MTPKRAIAAGMAFVTEDRRGEGPSIDRSIRENLSVVGLQDVRVRGVRMDPPPGRGDHGE